MNIRDALITAAFMWEGVKEDDKLLAHWDQGCIELCSEVTQFAELSEMYLESVFSVIEKDFPGVYDYEVSEPFGAWLRQHIERQDPAGPLGAPRINKRKAASELFLSVWDFFMRVECKHTDEQKTAVWNKMTNTKIAWLEENK